jgi:two-component system, LuxR family, response regulator TtrR
MPAAAATGYAEAFSSLCRSAGRLEPKRGSSTGATQPNPKGHALPGSYLVFLVDEDDAVRDALALSLRAAGHTVAAFGSGRQFLDAYQPGNLGCLVADLDLSEQGAVDLLGTIATSQPALPAIITSRRLRRRAPVNSLPAGRILFLDKPFGVDELLRLIGVALDGVVAGGSQGHECRIRAIA